MDDQKLLVPATVVAKVIGLLAHLDTAFLGLCELDRGAVMRRLKDAEVTAWLYSMQDAGRCARLHTTTPPSPQQLDLFTDGKKDGS